MGGTACRNGDRGIDRAVRARDHAQATRCKHDSVGSELHRAGRKGCTGTMHDHLDAVLVCGLQDPVAGCEMDQVSIVAALACPARMTGLPALCRRVEVQDVGLGLEVDITAHLQKCPLCAKIRRKRRDVCDLAMDVRLQRMLSLRRRRSGVQELSLADVYGYARRAADFFQTISGGKGHLDENLRAGGHDTVANCCP